MIMDYGTVVHDALSYATEGVYHRTERWLKLILATILLAIPLSGYIVRIYRGAAPAPEVENWRSLSLDGLKLMVIGLIYALPVIIISLIPYLFTSHSVGKVTSTSAMGQLWLLGTYVVLLFIFEVILAIFIPVASMRFARTRDFYEAFNFRALLDSIKRIGWLNYILALILIMIILGIPIFILEMIFLVIGMMAGHILYALGAFFVLIIIISPPLSVFQARYLTEVYDSGSPQEIPPSPK
jgi:hypothetical protein